MASVEQEIVYTMIDLLELDPVVEYRYLSDHHDERALYFSHAVFLIAQMRDLFQQTDTWVDELNAELHAETVDKDKTTALWHQVVTDLFADTGAEEITIKVTPKE